VGADVKFCGLTRAVDAALGAALGVRYLGVVLTDSPRRVTLEQAREVFAAAAPGGSPLRVGVFGSEAPEAVAQLAGEIGLDAVQLHGDPSVEHVRAVRRLFGGEIWAARRVMGTAIPDDIAEIGAVADRVLFDTRPSRGAVLGGSGEVFDWQALAASLGRLSARPPFVVAGGLTPANVAHAVTVLRPAVVDVSSGVESRPGIKDPRLMHAFVDALAVMTP
jgi:phosphoribosylanthranilate isomerase